MSTTFAVTLKNGESRDIARRVGRGVLGIEMWFTDSIAELLPDNTEVYPTDNSAQGIHTIGDIRTHIEKQQKVEEGLAAAEEWIDSKKIAFSKRNSVFVNLHDAWHMEHDFVEVTEWTNGEGWDITISDNKTQFALHFTEFEAIKTLIAALVDASEVESEYERNSAK